MGETCSECLKHEKTLVDTYLGYCPMCKLEEENQKLKEYIKDCDIQEYAGARYTCKHCGRLEDQGHYSHCPIVRFNLEKSEGVE